ncbi:MAG: HNH endonuclease [Deltaproteobacteria bacterium]|nr:MAG: HNH endonuclease [Deltaproteobacteria bacterium]
MESRLAQLAAAVGPLRRVLAALAARWIETRGHERLCYARLSDYARERPGVSARQLQELARVGRALRDLPRLERALVANELPWSKVRLLVRVLEASQGDEETWIALARVLSTQRLERAVREHAGTAVAHDPEREPTTRLTVRCSPAVLEKWLIAREFAERVAGQRLRAADALELVAAEVFSAISIEPRFVDTPEAPFPREPLEDTDPEDEPRPCPRASARELPHAVASLAQGLDEADAFELDRRLCQAVHLEQTLDAAIAPLLRVVTAAEYEWTDCYQPLARYAPESLGMSARKARALIRLERASEVCPELRDAYRSGRLSWVKAHCLLPLLLLDVDGEHRPIWVSWAERVTVRRLERDVERALLLRAAHDRAWFRCKLDPERAQDPIPPEERQMCAHDVDPEATQALVFRVPLDVAALFRGVRETLRHGLERASDGPVYDGDVFDAILDGALLSWTLRDPRARRPDPVAERDGYRCAVPGCTSRCNHHDHHITYRSRGGSDAQDNRVLLCAFHHRRCLHAGLMRISGQAPDGLLFELGLRSARGPLAVYRSGDVLASPACGGVDAALEQAA